MAQQRRSREWWQSTVLGWRRSGLSAEEFSAQEGISVHTLRWWSSALNRGTRAKRGLPERERVTMVPLEISLPRPARAAAPLEVVVGDVVVRVPRDADVGFVGELVRSIVKARG